MIKFIAAAAMLTAPTTQPPPRGSCLEKDEAAIVLIAMIPPFVEASAEKCRSHLPPTAFLRAGSAGFVERLKNERAVSMGQVMTAFSKSTGETIPVAISDETLTLLLRDFVRAEVNKFNSTDCTGVNDMLDAVAPLPAKNIAQFVGGLLILKPEEQDSSFRVCPPQDR